jgi:hypothetical protein
MVRFRCERGRIIYTAKRSDELEKERLERVCGPYKGGLKIEV